MGETQLIIGTDVACTDGFFGRLRWLVVDPATRRVTYLAVTASDLAPGRLVPADQVASVGEDIMLRCTTAELGQFETTQEIAEGSMPHDLRRPGVEGIEQDTGYGNLTSTRDRIPGGGVALHRGEVIYAIDGAVGRLQGIAVDLEGGQRLTDLLLGTGHFWHRARIAVSARSVTRFGDGIRLDLTKDLVRELADTPGEGHEGKIS
ncbi:PRC-barrel domain-containing protein [Actinospica robiniae]|uniref:PRC-barrel domain-containing protein n=1 Tax=Actinospica robiniae TaxID=304901 RepID=UPI0003FB39C2|nr:hypothetical protein [Actinospica robiniae]